uniref:translation initiation factor IF-2 N-terminal domain-containing protein n=1 Tax=Nocardia abscessus TaxID=120957 RepID=UPI002456481F
MADQEPLETTSQDAEQLPERIRVHALAKLLGVTSKRVLAKLTELGADARSAQSNVDRAVAESVRDALVTVEADAEQPAAQAEAPASAQPPAPADEAPAPAAAEQAVPAPEARTETPFTGTGVIFSAPDVVSATQPSTGASAAPPTQLFTHSVRPEPEPVAPTVFESAAVVQAPLFLPPDAAAAEAARRQRRAEREARRTEEAAPEPVETAPEPVEDETEAGEDETESADQQGDADGQPRRRRRGRRGRGRGRGEQQSDGDGDGEESESDTETEDESAPETTEAAEAESGETAEGEDEDGVPEGSSRRRRRGGSRHVGGGARPGQHVLEGAFRPVELRKLQRRSGQTGFLGEGRPDSGE